MIFMLGLRKLADLQLVTCLNVLRNMNRRALGLYWLYLMHEPLFTIPIVVLGMVYEEIRAHRIGELSVPPHE
jgi:hypothetical protein